MKSVKAAKYWSPFILYMALIFYLSSLSNPSVPMPRIWNIDKVYHLIEYSILSFLAFYAFVHTPIDALSNNAVVWALLFASFFGATDEIHQTFVPGRQSSVFDWIFDVVGVFLGVAYALLWRKAYRLWFTNRKLSRNDEE